MKDLLETKVQQEPQEMKEKLEASAE